MKWYRSGIWDQELQHTYLKQGEMVKSDSIEPPSGSEVKKFEVWQRVASSRQEVLLSTM